LCSDSACFRVERVQTVKQEGLPWQWWAHCFAEKDKFHICVAKNAIMIRQRNLPSESMVFLANIWKLRDFVCGNIDWESSEIVVNTSVWPRLLSFAGRQMMASLGRGCGSQCTFSSGFLASIDKRGSVAVFMRGFNSLPHSCSGCSKSNLWLVLFSKKYWAGYSGQPIASVDVWCSRPPSIVYVFVELRPLWGSRNCVLSAIHQEQISSITEANLSVAALSWMFWKRTSWGACPGSCNPALGLKAKYH